MKITGGMRLAPDTHWEGDRAVLRYQGDGNLVLYDRRGPVWASDTNHVPGYVEMQGDGNLVIYDASVTPVWSTGPAGPGAWLEIDASGLRILRNSIAWQTDPVSIQEPPVTPGATLVRKLGRVRVLGQSFGDESGPRIVHGCSDFAALVKHHEDRDRSLRQLDVIARFQQYVRVLWRLNGWKWTTSGLTVDPKRDGWFDETLRDYLSECAERGIKVNLSSGDMNNWSRSEMEDGFRRVAQIAASVSQDVVWLSAATNELRGTMNGGESGENIATLEHLMRIWEQHYPWSLRAISDPESQDRAGMRKLARGNANVALIHDVRWAISDALRRSFNTMYENYPDEPVVQDEPTGPNGSPPHSEFSRLVYQPIDNPDELFALYTMHIITGQASTYFNDPALVSREDLDSTWGFKELPQLWRELDIPEDIGQGELLPGHRAAAPLQVEGSNAERADSVRRGSYNIGVISGGDRWKVRAGVSGHVLARTADRIVFEGHISRGEVLPISGPTPTVVRIIT